MDVKFEAKVKIKKGKAGFPDLFVLNTTDEALKPFLNQRVRVIVKPLGD